ncbi:MAG: chorismate-binding protein [Bacteroidales bacterium]|nr:chorismate-binding protein [Bacteroidales bacterium]MBN2764706.1 chorismate-binding protein [Bacteroidales bacterium]
MLNNHQTDYSFAEAVSVCIRNNLTFAAYRQPDANRPVLVVQSHQPPRLISPQDDHDTLSGFLVTPFTETACCTAFLIEPDLFTGTDVTEDLIRQLKALKHEKLHDKGCSVPGEISGADYRALIKTIVNYIHLGTFEKVVPSRVKIIRGVYTDKLGIVFNMLCRAYPSAFIYIFNNGDHLWMGATPEPLLLAMNGTMQTVSQAGTRSYSEENANIGAWNSKERLEQEYVTRYISRVIAHYNLTDVDLQGPYTRKAGNLLHLCTDFSFSARNLKGRLGEFLHDLHPTPAVCGMPYRPSLELLMKLEKHEREYYAGYLGPVGPEGRISLFVNLRCMKVLHDRLALFIGGGITADSVPEEEWLETEIKAETLLSVINQL